MIYVSISRHNGKTLTDLYYRQLRNALNTSYGMFGQFEPDIMKYIENDIETTRDVYEKRMKGNNMPTNYNGISKLYWNSDDGYKPIGKITNATDTSNGFSFTAKIEHVDDKAVKLIFDPKAWMKPKKVIFNNPATIVFWNDGSKTVVKCENEDFDPEKGFAMAFMKHVLGNKGNYYNVVKDAIKDYEPIDITNSVTDGLQNIADTITKFCDLWK